MDYIYFLDIIKAVPLAAVSPATGTTVTVSGWGKTSDNSGVADVLHYVSVPTISNEECDVYGGIMWEGMICTSGAGGKGSCNVRFFIRHSAGIYEVHII